MSRDLLVTEAGEKSAEKSAAHATRARTPAHAPPSAEKYQEGAGIGLEAGNFAVQNSLRAGAVQAKMAVGSPGDAQEQEADRVAEQVMSPAHNAPVQGQGQGEEMLQPKEAPGQTPRVTHGAERSLSSLRGDGGQPLPAPVRAFFEPRFGRDFTHVRVHTGDEAAESARAIHAKAFTAGHEMVFGRGEYEPETASGRKLIAHELAHVVQQESAPEADQGIQRQPATGSPPAATAAPATPAAAPAAPTAAPSPNSPQVPKAKGILDGVVITTYTDLAGFYNSHVAEISAEQKTMGSEGVMVPAVLSKAYAEGLQLSSVVKAGGNLEVDDVTYEQADAWFTSYQKAMSFSELARATMAAQKLREVKAAAAQAQAANQRTVDAVADKRREAYQSNNETLLEQLWNWSTNLYDSILDLTPVIEEAGQLEKLLFPVAQGADVIGGFKYKLPEPSKLLPLLNKVNLAINAMQLVQATAALVGGGKSEADRAKTGIKSAVAIGSSIETLAGTFVTMPAGMSIYLNLYLQPMTEACLNALSRLESVARKGNKDLIERGEYDKVNWDLEPGGRQMFDFMRKVMAAQSADEIPRPVPQQVASYFVDNRSEIEKGAAGGKEGDEVPTTGFWFWRKVDEAKIAEWVFAHRRDLWAIFYGSAQPGANQ